MLSLLAMDLDLQTPIDGTLEDPSEDSSSPPTPGRKDQTPGVVIGASVGSLAILVVFLILLFFYRRNYKRRRRNFAPPVHLDPFRALPQTFSTSEFADQRGNTVSTARIPLNGQNPTSNPPDSSVIYRKPRLGESSEPVQPAALTPQVNNRGLHGEMEDLWREIDRLRADGLMLPPSYEMGRV